MWMRLSKFSHCNRLSVAQLGRLFSGADPGICAAAVDLRRADHWSLRALATILEASMKDICAGFCTTKPQAGLSQASTELRYCPACLALGFHAAWFQWQHLERCPLHDEALRTGCVCCSAQIPYVVGFHLALSPLCCPSCGFAWVPRISRPAGRCLPLPHRESRVIERWAVYVNHVVTSEYHPRRDWHTGRFIVMTTQVSPPAKTRAHHLTMLNRLFDAPPPLLAQLVTHRACQRHRPLAIGARPVIAPDCRATSYDRVQWPHFADDFELYDRLVRDMQRESFAQSQRARERDCWEHLLGQDLAVASDVMCRDTAAALGWSVSWMGASQALAPLRDVPMPALGLAGWLANLPLRPQGTLRHCWRSQVLEWLHEDLLLSAWMWSRIAAFMRSKGAYLLHGAMVNPRELARSRCTQPTASSIFTSTVD